MELKFIHFYPDLMSLYGSYANIAVLQRFMEQLGHSVTVTRVAPGQPCDLSDADFIFMGAGTERAQKAALQDFIQYGESIKTLSDQGTAMLFCGAAMELLGKSVTDSEGRVFEGIGLAPFTAIQGSKRFVEDIYGHTTLYPEAVVGFMNKCSIITGIETPLLHDVRLGFGNSGSKTPEGFHQKNVFASQLTGPILVKNPHMLEKVAEAIFVRRGTSLPAQWPTDHYAEQSYTITAQQLKLRCQ